MNRTVFWLALCATLSMLYGTMGLAVLFLVLLFVYVFRLVARLLQEEDEVAAVLGSERRAASAGVAEIIPAILAEQTAGFG